MNCETEIYHDNMRIYVEYSITPEEIEIKTAAISNPASDFLMLDLSDQHTHDTILAELEEALDYLTQPY